MSAPSTITVLQAALSKCQKDLGLKNDNFQYADESEPLIRHVDTGSHHILIISHARAAIREKTLKDKTLFEAINP